ncbi:MAG: HD-GYP domain-containing protein [Pirellulaceae bacterium]
MRILIVDDDDLALGLLESVLLKAGHQVDRAHDGNEALDWVRKGVHRIIISDWDMPGIDGLTLCRKVRGTTANYIYFILLTGHASSSDIIEGLSAGADDFIVKPFRPAELLLRVRISERLLSLETRDIAIFTMAKLAESRDRETGQHLERVRCFSQMLAQHLMEHSAYSNFIDDSFVRLIYETSPLHDIGKVGIPDSILLKPGKLSEDEFAIMKTHTLLGVETLEAALAKYPDAQFLRFACDIVACHHERYDGTGYPRGLVGENIPLAARIVALADVYDALTSKRIYKQALSHEEAFDIIVQGSGRHFDPVVVAAFRAIASSFAETRHLLNDNEPAFTLPPLLIKFGCHEHRYMAGSKA